jgi:hypothetical protein
MPEQLTMPVIFRRPRSKRDFENDGVTAVFPTEPHDVSGRFMTCYAHVGQHGSCSWDWYHTTRPATPEEYADLLKELRGIYETSICEEDPIVTLVVRQRISPQHRQAFNAEVRRVRSMAA